MTLLIVDDEKIICDGLKTIVSRLELPQITSIRTAYRADRAIEIAREETLDILITDARMPGRSGLELIAELRKLNRHLQSIVLTGHDDFELVRTALRLEALDYLLKPASKEELQAVLERAAAELTALRDGVRTMEDERIGQYDAVVDAAWAWFVEGSELTRDTIAYLDQALSSSVGLPHLLLVVIEHPVQEPLELARRLLSEGVATSEHQALWRVRSLSDSAVLAVIAGRSPDALHHSVEVLGQLIESSRYRDAHVSASHVRKGVGSLPVLFQSCRIARVDKLLSNDRIHRFEPEPPQPSTRDAHEPAIRPLIAAIEQLVTASDLSDDLISSAAQQLRSALVSRHQALVVWDQITSMLAAIIGGTEAGLREIEEYFSIDAIVDDLVSARREPTVEMPAGLPSEARHPLVRRAMKYAARNYQKQHTMRVVAEAMGLSYAYFSTLFKQGTGVTYTHYLLELRMSHARRLLEEGVFTIGDIAARVGYLYPKHFTRAFRNHEGISPSDYARGVRGSE